jgi:hypothetical protein
MVEANFQPIFSPVLQPRMDDCGMCHHSLSLGFPCLYAIPWRSRVMEESETGVRAAEVRKSYSRLLGAFSLSPKAMLQL